jgi:hypothetical protein
LEILAFAKDVELDGWLLLGGFMTITVTPPIWLKKENTKMKQTLLAIAFLGFIVIWKTYDAVTKADASTLYFYNQQIESKTTCVIEEAEQRKDFASRSEADEYAERLGKERKNWDIKIYEMKEVK